MAHDDTPRRQKWGDYYNKRSAILRHASFVSMLTVTVLALAFGCTAVSSRLPTSDVPAFAEGEAVAVVKTWASGRKAAIHDAATCLDYYDIFLEATWDSEYLGNGVWAVSATTGREPTEWRVYEQTGAVDRINAGLNPLC